METTTPETTTTEIITTTITTTPETTTTTPITTTPETTTTTMETTTPETTTTTTEATTTTEITTTTITTTPETTTTTPITTTPETRTTEETTTTEITTTTITTTPETKNISIITGPTPSHSPQVLISTSQSSTTKESTTTITPAPPPDCKDLLKNESWPNGAQWTKDCSIFTCIEGVIHSKPVECLPPVVPVCPRDTHKLIKDKEGCCDIWTCDCQCDVYGDPHYTTFEGHQFVFLENCTYTLVEETTSRYNFKISVDNYYCEPFASCVKGIILKYQNNTATLQVIHDSKVTVTLNQVTIQPPHEAGGLRFESIGKRTYIYIKEIRSYIFLSIWNTLQINLAMEHFKENTRGQCGVCGGGSCMRKNGTIENKNCCHKTAYEWIEDDLKKPHCLQVPKNVPCSPPPPKPTPCPAPHCEVLRHNVFKQCGDIDEKLVENCKFDYCLSNKTDYVCSALERLDDDCKQKGICVEWRNLTNGLCVKPCPEGMIYDPCRHKPDDYCSGTMRVSPPAWDTMQSGCFCPHNQLLAGPHKQICVSQCTCCKNADGKPMLPGSTWESNCQICTCNNQTLTEECEPKPLPPTPKCEPGYTLVSDCCNHPICVEAICEYNGKKYKAGDTWRDPKSPCETFRCTTEGTKIEKTVCPQQHCPEELRVWDQDHCCYSCNSTCGVSLSNVTFENCSPELSLPICEGNCAPGPQWEKSEANLQLEQKSSCCRIKSFEMKQIPLVCNKGKRSHYTYKHITSCACQHEG